MHPKISVGKVVLYQTDERGGLRYVLPAVITCTDETHPGGWEGVESGVDDGTNPVPIPNTKGRGEVHLHVMTPGAMGQYTEHSVPFDNSENPAPRTWRFLDDEGATYGV